MTPFPLCFNPLKALFACRITPSHPLKACLFQSLEFPSSFLRLSLAPFLLPISLILFCTPESQAGIFFLPHYIPEGQRAVGIEPQWLLSQGASLGVQFRYGQGVSELINVSALIGTGSDPNRFRAGGAATFDFYPNEGDQPGLGLALQGVYTDTTRGGMWSFSGTPYLHQTFAMQNMIPIEPFLALPLEQQIFTSKTSSQLQASFIVGSFFHYGEHWSSVLELGIGITQVMTVFSGGLIYYY